MARAIQFPPSRHRTFASQRPDWIMLPQYSQEADVKQLERERSALQDHAVQVPERPHFLARVFEHLATQFSASKTLNTSSTNCWAVRTEVEVRCSHRLPHQDLYPRTKSSTPFQHLPNNTIFHHAIAIPPRSILPARESSKSILDLFYWDLVHCLLPSKSSHHRLSENRSNFLHTVFNPNLAVRAISLQKIHR